MSRVVVICPSRGRPGNVAELVDCWQATGARARLVVCVDTDDPTGNEYCDLVRPGVSVLHGERRSLGGWANFAAGQYADSCDVFGIIGDDVRPRTFGWDKAIVDAMPPLGVVYGDDLHQGERLPTHPFMDAEIVRRLQFIAPPGVEHLYLDDFWKALGERLGTLTFLPDVVLEHMHPHAGKAEMDDGYVRVNSREAYRSGRKAFEAYMASRFDADVEGVLRG